MEQFLTRYKSETGLLFACLLVTYFLVYKTVLTPPLKGKELVFSLTAVIEIFVVLRVASLARRPRLQFSWFFSAVVAYFVALLLLTFSIPTSPLFFREARGLVCNEDFVSVPFMWVKRCSRRFRLSLRGYGKSGQLTLFATSLRHFG